MPWPSQATHPQPARPPLQTPAGPATAAIQILSLTSSASINGDPAAATTPRARLPLSPRPVQAVDINGAEAGIAIAAAVVAPAMLALATVADHVEGGTVALMARAIETLTGLLNTAIRRGREV